MWLAIGILILFIGDLCAKAEARTKADKAFSSLTKGSVDKKGHVKRGHVRFYDKTKHSNQ